ncbi:hypothetical protein [Actinoallomurus sp. CA-150999]|uniref:hypothetical protein n=1 Tax=Actinoallomurus sp. CA-150999 TaxID=3239887 RepID=UPI003D8B6514
MMPRRAGLPRRTRRSLTVIVAAALLTGCARGEHGSAGGAPTTPVVTVTPAPASAPAAATATPTPASPTPRPTANRSALKACKGGKCEVTVTRGADIPVDARRFQVGTINVRSVDDRQVSLVITLPTASNRLDCQGDEDCDSSVVGGTNTNTGYVNAHAGAVITVNRLVIQVVSVGNGSAVLRLKPA